ncbi:MAG: MotA/TolQ/ExbB proton channel family protein [Candidatus Omnitrophota bacterium]|nr:MotA/TolQ/ExbB proton channel family protein [Candidatus Omnitrophota bacterium]
MMDNLGGMNAWRMIWAGGPIMIPILLCSLFALGIMIEKFFFFHQIETNVSQFKKEIFEHLQKNRLKEAVQLCDANPSPVAKIFQAGLMKQGASKEEIKEALQDASLFEIPKLESRLNVLATIANMAPLLGLLGTVVGMISCFHTIQMRTADLNPVTPGDLAGGISVALLTTLGGLLVAIPAYIAYHYFVHRVNTLVLEMERGATELVHFMSQMMDVSS